MIFELNINTTLDVKELKDLPKLKTFLEVNELGKPNFSQLGKS